MLKRQFYVPNVMEVVVLMEVNQQPVPSVMVEVKLNKLLALLLVK
jgi:hypothetical protein